MADSKLLNPNQAASQSVDLVQCGICYAVIHKPKALPCLHTFCQMCLSKWAESAAKKDPTKFADVISCPSCRESFPLPPGGVQSLRSNFFVTKLKEKHSIERQLESKDVPVRCTACSRISNNSAVARCVDCNDFLCAKCLEAHRAVRVVKDHKILTLDELRSGELTMPNLPEQEICSKHKGEILRYHCEKCDEPICRECMAIDHPQPQHKHVDLKTIATKRGSDIKELAQQCEEVLKEVTAALKSDKKLVSVLEDNIKEAKSDHMWLTEELKIQILAMVAENSRRITDKLQQAELNHKSDIDRHSAELQVIKERLEYVLKVAHQLTESGSEHDLVSSYASLSSILIELGKVKAKSADELLATVKLESIKELILKLGVIGPLASCSKWEMVKEFEIPNSYSQANVIVDDLITVKTDKSVCIFDFEGNKQATIDTPPIQIYHYKPAYPIKGIAKNSKGLYFVASSYLKILDTKKETRQKYIDVAMTKIQLTALTTDEEERLVACGFQQTSNNIPINWYIKIYKDQVCEKTLQISLPVSTQPSYTASYITLTKDGNFIVSSMKEVYVYTANGQLRYGLEQPDGQTVQFGGVYCSKFNEIYVATTTGIHRYSTKGDHLEVITTEVDNPHDLALRDDGNELVVVESNKVKVFRLK